MSAKEPDPLYALLVAGIDPPATFLERLAALRPAWHRDAACRGMGTPPWFPERGSDSTTGKAICNGCPVRTECLDSALELDEVGTWGRAQPARAATGRARPRRLSVEVVIGDGGQRLPPRRLVPRQAEVG